MIPNWWHSRSASMKSEGDAIQITMENININNHNEEYIYVRRLLDNAVTVMWVDNFSKSYAVALQGIESGAWKDCNWTGRGIKVFCGTPVDIKMGDLPAMPDNALTHETKQLVRSKLAAHVSGGWMLLQHSIVQKYKVNNVPLKPILDPLHHSRLCRILAESRDGLSFFHPWDIIPQNIGSNRGLMLILKQISDERQPDDRHIKFLSADCNIFMRVMRVR